MPSRSKNKICIADDDKAFRESLRAFLEACGDQAEAIARGDEFLLRADVQNADCLLLDFDIPGAGGQQILERLRARGLTTPAIVLTTNGKRLGARLQKAGVLKGLSKPVTDEELLLWLEKACG